MVNDLGNHQLFRGRLDYLVVWLLLNLTDMVSGGRRTEAVLHLVCFLIIVL